MSFDLVVKNARVVSPAGITEGVIGIKAGKIAAIMTDASLITGDQTLDAGHQYVLPGLIDPHVHFAYLGSFEDQFKSEPKAAAMGGVTTVGNYLILPQGVIDQLDGLIKLWNSSAVIDGFFHSMVVSEKTIGEIPECYERGITSFKFLMGYKGPQAELLGITATDDGKVFGGFEKIAKLPGAVGMVHAENIDIILMMQKRYRNRQDHAVWGDSRPRFCEAETMHRAINLARAAGNTLYIVHMTIGEGVEIVGRAKAEGLPVIAETCPQYLTVTNDNGYLKKHPAFANVNPPIRYDDDLAMLWKGLQDGRVDLVGTDHAPVSAAKKGDDIWNAPMGLGNLTEYMLPVMLSEGVNKGKITLERLVEVCCYKPAQVFGLLPKKGVICAGADADLVFVDLHKKKIPESKYSAAEWSPWAETELEGWPTLTMVRGEIVMKEGTIVGKEGTGRFIPRPVTKSFPL